MAIRNLLHEIIPDGDSNREHENYPLGNIKRRNIQNHGFLGSTYDICKDTIIGRIKFRHEPSPVRLTGTTECDVFKGGSAECQNLLALVRIGREQRLSILSDLVQPNGIASLIRYEQQINKRTRFLSIFQKSQKYAYANLSKEIRNQVLKCSAEISSTHIVTEVITGIHAVIILQLPIDGENEIDPILEKMKNYISSAEAKLPLQMNEKYILDNIVSLNTYSNISELVRIKKLEDICEKIKELQNNIRSHKSLEFTLTPIEWFYGKHSKNLRKYFSITADIAENLEYYLIGQAAEIKQLNFRLKGNLADLLQGKLTRPIQNIEEKLSKLKALQMRNASELGQIISNIRNGNEQEKSITNESKLDPPNGIKTLLREITKDIEGLESKQNLISMLESAGIEYCDVSELGIEKSINEKQISEMLLGNLPRKVIMCSKDSFRNDDTKDSFRNDDTKDWCEKYTQIKEGKQHDPSLEPVYADFTYSTYDLRKTMIIYSRALQNDDNKPEIRENIRIPETEPLSNSIQNEINILLLGESGVGKSTFVNAFANYLRFKTLDDGEKGTCIVIIPVSFMMTVGDDFEEKIIHFGETDPNEDFNDFGQSVTQKCKSYVFHISNEQKLRFIDTPGFGDTRGYDQDKLNMENVFNFLHHIDHINGICLLSKPEVLEVNPFIRSCFTQLFEYFGDKIQDSVLFCFTNARSTFFAPGNSRPLLKQLFDSFQDKHIPFEKANTFCFDSESFRYLVAKQNSIEFNNMQREEFRNSWERSVQESFRFREFLYKTKQFRKGKDWMSNVDIHFQINLLIRPILETIRNILRNVLSFNSNSSIQLKPVQIQYGSFICYQCTKTPKKFGYFYILQDHAHNVLNQCTSKEQVTIPYRLEYEAIKHRCDESIEDMHLQVDSLCVTCAVLSVYLLTSNIWKDDQFQLGLRKMIDQEKITFNKTSNDSNKKLASQLEEVQNQYERKYNEIRSKRQSKSLKDIYELINFVNQNLTVKIQMNVIRKNHQDFLKKHERYLNASGVELK